MQLKKISEQSALDYDVYCNKITTSTLICTAQSKIKHTQYQCYFCSHCNWRNLEKQNLSVPHWSLSLGIHTMQRKPTTWMEKPTRANICHENVTSPIFLKKKCLSMHGLVVFQDLITTWNRLSNKHVASHIIWLLTWCFLYRMDSDSVLHCCSKFLDVCTALEQCIQYAVTYSNYFGNIQLCKFITLCLYM